MTPDERKMIGYALSEARRGLPSPKKEFKPGQKRTMTVEDAVPLLNAVLGAMQSAIRVTVATLNKIEQGKVEVPADLVIAAEKTYSQPEGRLTNVYQKRYDLTSDAERRTFDSSHPFLNSLSDRKRVIVRAITGGGSAPWRTDRNMGIDLQVFSFLKDTDVVVLDRQTFGYPKSASLAFEKLGDPQVGTVLLLRNKAAPDTCAIRVPGDSPGTFRGEGSDELLRESQWSVSGWAFAWATRVGHGYPEWSMSELGLRPR